MQRIKLFGQEMGKKLRTVVSFLEINLEYKIYGIFRIKLLK